MFDHIGCQGTSLTRAATSFSSSTVWCFYKNNIGTRFFVGQGTLNGVIKTAARPSVRAMMRKSILTRIYGSLNFLHMLLHGITRFLPYAHSV